MILESLRQYRHQQPFQPLRLHLVNGELLEVRHPQLLLVTGKMLAVGVAAPQSPDIAERIRLLWPDQIERVEPLAEPAIAT
jgi:hypothetical protein